MEPTDTTTRIATTGPRLTPRELGALVAVGLAVAGFTGYGLATGAPSTIGYVASVAAVTGALVALRRRPLPGALPLALAAIAIGHLAGGLVNVGDEVLYNVSFRTEILRYDHLLHGTAVFVGTLTVRALFAAHDDGRSPGLLAVWVLSGLGLGAINELVEFLATLAHGGLHVGGYDNTGWDLVSNLVGGVAAGVVIARSSPPRLSGTEASRFGRDVAA